MKANCRTMLPPTPITTAGAPSTPCHTTDLPRMYLTENSLSIPHDDHGVEVHA